MAEAKDSVVWDPRQILSPGTRTTWFYLSLPLLLTHKAVVKADLQSSPKNNFLYSTAFSWIRGGGWALKGIYSRAVQTWQGSVEDSPGVDTHTLQVDRSYRPHRDLEIWTFAHCILCSFCHFQTFCSANKVTSFTEGTSGPWFLVALEWELLGSS